MTGDLMPMQSAGHALREIVAQVAEDMAQPAARAGLGASLLTSALLARARMGFVPTIVIALMIGVSVEQLYAMAEDIHAKLAPPQLVFHGYGCPGHTTGKPAESCMTDEAKPV